MRGYTLSDIVCPFFLCYSRAVGKTQLNGDPFDGAEPYACRLRVEEGNENGGLEGYRYQMDWRTPSPCEGQLRKYTRVRQSKGGSSE